MDSDKEAARRPRRRLRVAEELLDPNRSHTSRSRHISLAARDMLSGERARHNRADAGESTAVVTAPFT